VRTTHLSPHGEGGEEPCCDNRELASAARELGGSSPAGEWLLDNYYLIEEQILLVRADLPPTTASSSPASWVAATRTSRASTRPCSHSSRTPTRASTRSTCCTSSTATRLSRRWRSARHGRCRSCFASASSRTCDAVARRGPVHARERLADTWAQRIVLTAQDDPDALPILIAEVDAASRGALPSFFVRLSQRLGEFEAGGEAVNAWLSAGSQPTASSWNRLPSTLSRNRHPTKSPSPTPSRASDCSMPWTGASFSSESQSPRRYCAKTRPHLRRHGLRKPRPLSARARAHGKAFEKNEIEIAEQVVALAGAAFARDATDDVRGHVAGGSSPRPAELEPLVGYRTRAREAFYRGPLANHGLFYWERSACWRRSCQLCSSGTRSTKGGALAGPARARSRRHARDGPGSRGGEPPVFRGVPAAGAAQARPSAAGRGVAPHPRRDSALLSSIASTREIIEHLEVLYLANLDGNVAFGLLGDLKASASSRAKTMRPSSKPRAWISELNERYEVEHGSGRSTC